MPGCNCLNQHLSAGTRIGQTHITKNTHHLSTRFRTGLSELCPCQTGRMTTELCPCQTSSMTTELCPCQTSSMTTEFCPCQTLRLIVAGCHLLWYCLGSCWVGTNWPAGMNCRLLCCWVCHFFLSSEVPYSSYWVPDECDCGDWCTMAQCELWHTSTH